MSHQLNNDHDNQSIEMDTINDQSHRSSSSKEKSVRSKFIRKKHNIVKWKNTITNSVKHRRDVLNKILINAGDSLIEVHGYNHDLTSVKNKYNKQNDIITINVSGNRYQTHISTLENYPNTLLGNKEKRSYYWNNEKNEYFFDRHRSCFESILYYYQSNGRLRRPDYVPLDTFIEEISFFDLGPEAISQINKLENISIIKYVDLPNWLWRRYIWFYLEYPQNSIFGRILHFISMAVTMLACVTLAIETLPQYNEKGNHSCKAEENQILSLDYLPICLTNFTSPFFLIQIICVSYFTIEFLLRLISTPSYYRFILSIFNWIDLGVIVPYFVLLGFALVHKETNSNENFIMNLRIFQVLRFLRVFKFYSIFKQLKPLRVLSSTLRESFIDFILMIIILTLVAFLFGAATYLAERNTNGYVFDSIPKATYWGILTITTVGYGDMYPITIIGRILACLCALIGLAISGMLASVLVTRYQRIYNRKKFFPEQIFSAIDACESVNEEKQDFINRKISRSRKLLSSGPIFPKIQVPSFVSPKKNRKHSRYNTPSSYIRFIITLIDDETNNKSMHQIANKLMKQLTETIKNSGDQINLKLISTEKDSSNDKISTTNQLSSISEEAIF